MHRLGHGTRIVAALCAATLAGCASTRGLEPQGTLITPAQLHAEQSLAGLNDSQAAWPQEDWWKAAGDPQLDQLIDAALAGNPDMALADARVRDALAQAGLAEAQRKPTLTASGSVVGVRLPPLAPPIASGDFGVISYVDLAFKWDLDLWGGRRDAWEAAVGAARAAAVDARAARLVLSADVARAYFSLGGARVQQTLAQSELQRAQDFLDLTEQRVASGIDSQFTLARIQGEIATARAHLEAASNAVRTDGFMLAALLGAGPDRARDIAAPPPPGPALDLPSNLPADLLGRRPDVVAARWRVEAAGKSISAAKAAFLPNISIGAMAGLVAPSGTNLLSLNKSGFYQAAPALSLPIFEGGRFRANLASKDATRDMAVAHYNQTLVNAIREVATASVDVRSLDTQIADARAARASARQAYDLAMRRYRAGVGTYIEALSVREQLIVSEQQLAAMESRRAQSWVALNESLGGGFRPSPDAPALAASTTSHQ